jgi:hypothetical protein
MLTAEEKKRIEEAAHEEIASARRALRNKQELMQRIAALEEKEHEEDGYLEEVIARVLPVEPKDVPWWKRSRWTIGIAAAVVIVVPFQWGSFRHWSSQKADGAAANPAVSAPAPANEKRYVLMDEPLVSGRFTLAEGEHLGFPIRITPEMTGSTVKGNFQAACAYGNCIAAAIVEESDYAKWMRDPQAPALWRASGHLPVNGFEVALTPGRYYIVFSNGVHALRENHVYLDAVLEYQRPLPVSE